MSLNNSDLSIVSAELGSPAMRPSPIVEWMKSLPIARRMAAENILRAATPNFTPTAAQRQACDLMSWADLESLDPSVLAIGAHTVNHPILTSLPPEEVDREIRESRTLLEKRLRRPVPFFCYPNGNHNPHVIRTVASCFEAAVTTEPGASRAGTQLYQIPRLPIGDSLNRFSWRLHRYGA
jgi:peptidoglycan/xylan/chitin deacetylase (PgdA/CDA1 family)